jgi:N-acetylmuramoyl-L-alanine amidase
LQVIKGLVQTAEVVGGRSSLLNSYSDRTQVPSTEVLTVATALQHRLVVSPEADRLSPLSPITRAEAAAMLYQTLVAKGKAVEISTPQIVNPGWTSGVGQSQQALSGGSPPVVVLDPGHGGSDPGVTTKAKSTEAEMMPMPPEGISPLEGMSGIPMSPLPAGMMAPGMPPMMPGPAGMPPGMLPGIPSGTSSLPPGMSEAMPAMTAESPAMPSLEEKAIVLSVAQAVAGFLQQQGVQVILTRSDDRDLSPDERLQTVAQNQADIFVSIHVNANTARQSDVNGIETYYDPEATEGARLAWAIHKALTRTPDVADRGVHPAYFYLLRNAPVPAVHVEVGYITGNSDASSLANLAYHRYLARAIATGILRYVSQKRR